jgi:hypothetical protein
MDAGTTPERSEVSDAAVPDRTVAGASEGSRPGPGAPIDLAGILGEAWSIFAMAWPACLIVYWGAGAASWLILVLLTAMRDGLIALAADREIAPILDFLLFLAIFLVPAWLWVGQNLALLRIARRQSVALEDLFHGGPWLLTTLLAAGVLSSIAALPCLVIYGSGEALLSFGGADALASLLRPRPFPFTAGFAGDYASHWLVALAISVAVLGASYLAFLAISARLGQFAYLVIDRNAGVVESHRLSWELTRGRSATVFLVYLAQLALNLAGLLAFYVGLFVTLPLTGLLSAVTYNALCGHPEPAARPASAGGEDDMTSSPID